jgi:hypothetical protein
MTVEEVLKQSGFTDDQIGTLDRRAITAFSGVLSQAEQERTAAEQARQANADFYDNQIAPSLVNWADEKSRLDGELSYYKAQVGSLRNSGFLPPEPAQPRDGQGRYVAGAPGGTPGSPTFDVNTVYQRAGDAVGLIADIQWEHERLFGQKMPVSPTELIRQADAVKLDPRTYAARTFKWDQKRTEMEAKTKQDEVDRITKEVEQRKDREWSERIGSNPDVRRPVDSRYTDMQRATKAGTLPDPLMLSESERRQATRAAIRHDAAEAER